MLSFMNVYEDTVLVIILLEACLLAQLDLCSTLSTRCELS